MARARRLAWIAGAAGLAAVVVVAVLALPELDPAPPAAGSEGSAGSSAGLAPDAAAPSRPRAAVPGEPPPGSDVEQAARLVASARAEVTAGHLIQARALLARAYALDPQPATLLELAAADLQTGHCREARRAVQRVIADGADALSSRAWELMGEIGRCD